MQDPGVAIYDLATHFIVVCPKCEGKALVKTKEEGQKLVCTACFHVEEPGHWYGAMTAYVSVKCRECRTQLTRSAPWDGKWKKLAMHCHNCGDQCEYEAHISQHWIKDGLVCDSVYGLPLWLQKSFQGEMFWAFNEEHLLLLEQYITAKLRERGIPPVKNISRKSTMLNRLPAFISKAGNRAGLLKLIQQMRAR